MAHILLHSHRELGTQNTVKRHKINYSQILQFLMQGITLVHKNHHLW